MKLQAGQSVFLDTAPLIYYIEEDERYLAGLSAFLEAVTAVGAKLITSLMTYIEVLTLPEKQGQAKLAARYREFMTNSDQLSIYPLTLAVADAAIRLRAHEGLRTPDAIQLATAQACGVDYVLTNDRSWRKIRGLRIVLVEDLPHAGA